MENYEAVSILITAFELGNLGVEIGLRSGKFSEYLLKNHPDLSMVGVDPYLPYQDVVDYWNEEMQEKAKAEMKSRLGPFGDRFAHLCKTSIIGSEILKSESVDFVFIDAEHSHAAVTADITAWLPKIRAGGALIGHDYRMDGVGAAVHAYFDRPHTPISATRIFCSPPDADIWWVRV